MASLSGWVLEVRNVWARCWKMKEKKTCLLRLSWKQFAKNTLFCQIRIQHVFLPYTVIFFVVDHYYYMTLHDFTTKNPSSTERIFCCHRADDHHSSPNFRENHTYFGVALIFSHKNVHTYVFLVVEFEYGIENDIFSRKITFPVGFVKKSGERIFFFS